MNKTKIFAGLLVASLTSVTLYAAPGMTGEGVTKADAMAKADAKFAKMDANNDGALNQADRAARVKQQFAKMDADNNGSVSEAEFMAAREARIEKRGARMEKREERRAMRGEHKGKGHRMGRGKGGGMKMLARADANGDKSVTQAEFRAAAEARFTKTDSNNDGTVTADERKAQHAARRGDRAAEAN